MPVTAFQYMGESEQALYTLAYPTVPVSDIQAALVNVYNTYDAAFTNRKKIDECLLHFKEKLEVDPNLHMRETFHKWRVLIPQPDFRVTLTEDRKYVKEIIAKGLPQKIRETQKHIRELLLACKLYVEQFNHLQETIELELHNISHLITNMDYTGGRTRQNVQDECNEVLEKYRCTIGWMSQFDVNIKVLMKEIKESVDVLTKE
jgi:hypothetical protein